MSEINVTLVRRWFDEVWNQRQESVIDELLDDNSICHADTGAMRGPDEFRQQQLRPFLAAFPDIQVEVQEAIGQGDHVAVRWKAVATHTGEGLGFKPTGDAVTFHGITWTQVKNGKLAEGWQFSNIGDVIRNLAQRAQSESGQ